MPFFVLFPWSLHLLTDPISFVTEAGVQTAGLTTTGLGPRSCSRSARAARACRRSGSRSGSGCALIAVLLPTRRTWVTGVGWGTAIVGFVAAVALSRINVTPAGGGQPAAGWPGVALALAALGLLLAVAPAAGWLAEIASNERVVSPAADTVVRGPGRAAGGGYGAFSRALAIVALVVAAVGARPGRPVLGQGRRAGAGRQRELAAAARVRLRVVYLGPAVPDADPAARTATCSTTRSSGRATRPSASPS